MLVHFLFDQTQSLKRALAVATIIHGNCLKRDLALLQTYNTSVYFFIFLLLCILCAIFSLETQQRGFAVAQKQRLIMCSHAGIMKRCRKSLTSEPSLLQILSG